jgi:predicted aspartyl protease
MSYKTTNLSGLGFGHIDFSLVRPVAIITVELLSTLSDKAPFISTALIDTGATISAISTKAANELGLHNTGRILHGLEGVLSGPVNIEAHLARIRLNLANNVIFDETLEVPVLEKLPSNTDFIIGLDILHKFEFCYSGQSFNLRLL